MTLTGSLSRPLTIGGTFVPVNTVARQVTLSGRGKFRFCVIVPGVGRKYLVNSIVIG